MQILYSIIGGLSRGLCNIYAKIHKIFISSVLLYAYHRDAPINLTTFYSEP